MRRRQLKRLWARLKQLSTMQLTREELLMKLGAARDQSRSAWRLVVVEVAADSATFSYRLDRNMLRQARSREGRYLLRTNLVEEDPAKLWSHYLLLVAVEEAFKNLKGDLAIRPVFHQLEARIEAHIFIAFLAYCLHVTLARRLHALAPGLTPRSVLEKFAEKFAAVQMIDVHLPTTDGRELVLTRYTEPEPELNLLLNKLKLDLPAQPPPKITASAPAPPAPL
jgi:transposase